MLEGLFTVDALVTFLILTALETVLGFDNLLYISIESKKVDPAREACTELEKRHTAGKIVLPPKE